mgnify:CR=1 FL=1
MIRPTPPKNLPLESANAAAKNKFSIQSPPIITPLAKPRQSPQPQQQPQQQQPDSSKQNQPAEEEEAFDILKPKQDQEEEKPNSRTSRVRISSTGFNFETQKKFPIRDKEESNEKDQNDDDDGDFISNNDDDNDADQMANDINKRPYELTKPPSILKKEFKDGEQPERIESKENSNSSLNEAAPKEKRIDNNNRASLPKVSEINHTYMK